jgi:predicted DsbA family dithiol-disulfide isomerase
MRLICPDCISIRRNLLLAKEALSLFVRANGHRRDREIHMELTRLVNDHLTALQVWEEHMDCHAMAARAAQQRPSGFHAARR